MISKPYNPKRFRVSNIWNAHYEKLLVAVKPHLAGRVDWHTAKYYQIEGYTPEEAVEREIKHHESER